MTDPDDGPVVDLHESEWSRDGKRAPIFGPNAPLFAIMMLASYPCYWISKTTVEFLWSLLSLPG